MKNLYFPIIFLLLINNVFAQTTILGKVIGKNKEALLGASVYINNSTIGTTTNDDGEFELKIKEGNYTLIVSFIGYQTIEYNFDTKTYKRALFKLIPSATQLDEVVITNRKYSKETRAYYLKRFKQNFLGKGELSKDCIILNDEVISFDFDSKTRILEAYASKPIEIKNKALGYTLFYDLIHFELTPSKIYYLGYTRYQELEGSRRKIERWNKQRQKAYLGSKIHFLKSLLDNILTTEGFEIELYKREKNPLRPSEKEIAEAREYIKLTKKPFTLLNEPYLKIEPITKLDSVQDILSRSRLDEYKDILVQKNVEEKEIVTTIDNKHYLDYNHILKVKYLKEEEEDNFRLGDAKLPYQATKLLLLEKPARVFKKGILEKPFAIFYEGYFGYEKVAYQLPLDYLPKQKL